MLANALAVSPLLPAHPGELKAARPATGVGFTLYAHAAQRGWSLALPCWLYVVVPALWERFGVVGRRMSRNERPRFTSCRSRPRSIRWLAGRITKPSSGLASYRPPRFAHLRAPHGPCAGFHGRHGGVGLVPPAASAMAVVHLAKACLQVRPAVIAPSIITPSRRVAEFLNFHSLSPRPPPAYIPEPSMIATIQAIIP